MGTPKGGQASGGVSVEALEDRLLLAVTLVKDLNPNYSSNPTNFVSAGGIGYFTAYNSLNQPALWRTDGTAAGTFIPSERGHFTIPLPTQLTAVGNRIFLTAGTDAEQLWVADSTAGGTVRINTGMGMSGLGNLTAVGNILYFTASTNGAGQELWRSDGTPGGTFMVADIRPGSSSSAIAGLSAAGGRLFFFANDGVVGSQLWKVESGGVASRVTNFSDPLYALGAQQMGVLGGTVIFYAFSHDQGDRFWRSDGTAAGTYLLKDIGPTNPSPASHLVTWNGFVYLGARNAAYGGELWRTDGTVAGTALVADIYPGTTGSLASPRAVVGGYLLFSATDGVSATGSGGELYRTDGTIGNASLVRDINPGAASSGPFNFVTTAEGIGYFIADDGAAGAEPWRTDGTAAGTDRVADIYPGATTSNPQGGPLIDAGIIFAATTPLYGRELFLIPIDHVAPTVGEPEFLYDNPRGPAVRVTFSESVRDSLSSGDLVLVNRTTGKALATENLLLDYDPDTNVATFNFPAGFLPDGNYQIAFADDAVSDAAENPLTAGFSFDFFVLAGDANHDRTVDFQDLVALAQNYGSGGRTFSQGDFNDDSKVDFNDLVLLAQRYNTTLAPLPKPAARSPAVAKPAPIRKTAAPKPPFATRPIRL